MENLLVGTIVGLAVFFFVRGLYRSFQSKDADACGCGCSTCPSADACNLPENETES